MPDSHACRELPPYRLITPQLIAVVESLLLAHQPIESVAERTLLPEAVIQAVVLRMRKDGDLATKEDARRATLDALTSQAAAIQQQCHRSNPRPIIRDLARRYPELNRHDLEVLTGCNWGMIWSALKPPRD